MSRNNLLAAALLAVSIVALGLCIKGGIDNIAYKDRDVTVRGLAERQVNANYVTWPMSYSIAGNDLPALYDRMNHNNDAIVKFLTTNGIESKEVIVSAPRLYNSDSNIYNNNTKFRFNIEVTITVATSKVQKVRELINRQSELLKQDIACSSDWINYEFTDLNSIKPEMIAEATGNARVAADQFAKDSGSNVGKIKTAQQGQFSIEDSSPSTPQIKNVRVVSTVVYYLED